MSHLAITNRYGALGMRHANRDTIRSVMRRAMHRSMISVVFGTASIVLTTACNDLVGSAPLPAGVQDPSTYNTPAGALQQAEGATAFLQRVTSDVVVSSGVLTDELGGEPPSLNSSFGPVDARQLPEVINVGAEAGSPYSILQETRGQAEIAIGALAQYAPKVSPAVRGKIYAVEGYTELYLSDLFCSGIPLSTIDAGGNFTYKAGSSNAEVYHHAAALFDTALALASDSASVQVLARVGLGRALLALGQFDSAARVVAPVPNGAAYTIKVLFVTSSDAGTPFGMSDGEGFNGLPYVTSRDPRVPSDTETVIPAPGATGVLVNLPHKYSFAPRDSSPFTLADWIEARLIQAEASLHDGDNAAWLHQLNVLRTTAISPAMDTLTDPGTQAARVDTMFAERAYWLYMTGHRQGDLRRLVRQYGRPQGDVYPVGPYGSNGGIYGSFVNFPVPASERHNPLFQGCLNRGA